MAKLTSYANAMDALAKGFGYLNFNIGALTGTTTTVNAAAGHFALRLAFNGLGTTTPGTLVGQPMPSSLADDLNIVLGHSSCTSSRGVICGWLYRIGTLNLAATGDQFTHDAATFPLTRTIAGVSSAINFLPLIYITTATSVTAPAFQIRDAGSTVGYVDNLGNTRVGNKTFTLPAVATAAESTFLLRLNDGDNGIRDVTQINVSTAGTTGAATIYGFERVLHVSSMNTAARINDSLFNGLTAGKLQPATPTSGSLTALFCSLTVGASTVISPYQAILGVENFI
jgi:hypothetical protein